MRSNIATQTAPVRNQARGCLAPTATTALVVEYEGTRYCGFQLQNNAPTVQGEIESALRRLTGHDIRVKAASRTDTGVHARGQVVSFRSTAGLPLRAFVHGLNHYLPEDIAVIKAEDADDDFNVRHAAWRQYSYFIDNRGVRSPLSRRFSHSIAQTLDAGAMDEAAQELIGEHDFRSFATSLDRDDRSTVRRVLASRVVREGDNVRFDITANAFLPHQVRNTVGALIQVGSGRLSRSQFQAMMAARTPGMMGPTAPPNGLFLMQVNYSGASHGPEDESLQ